MVQQHVGGAGGARSQEGPDDAAGRLGGLERIELEPLVQIVRRAHGHELVERVEFFRAQRAEVPGELQHALEIGGRQRRRIRGQHAENRLHRHGHVVHQAAEQHRRLGVPGRVPGQLPAGQVGIDPGAQIVAVVERHDGALQRENLEPVPGQLEVADDLGAEQAHHIGKDRELESREDLLGDGGAPDQRPALQHQHFLAGAGQVGRRDQAVVAAPDEDRVVVLHDRFRSGSKKGSGVTRARAWRRWCSTVTSSPTSVPGSKCGARRWARARYCLSSGDQEPLEA